MKPPVFLGDFHSADDVFSAFGTKGDAYYDSFKLDPIDGEGVEILVAEYEIEGYEGSAAVLFRKGGELFEVYASHCSCFGLEDQWKPEPVELVEFMARAKKAVDAADTDDWYSVHDTIAFYRAALEILGG